MKVKTALYKLSPYETTICLDADTIWINKRSINDLFNELKDENFTMANRSFMDLEEERITDEFGVWASPN